MAVADRCVSSRIRVRPTGYRGKVSSRLMNEVNNKHVEWVLEASEESEGSYGEEQ